MNLIQFIPTVPPTGTRLVAEQQELKELLLPPRWLQGTCRQCREHRASIRSESAGIHPARRTGLRRADIKTSDAMRDLVVSPAMGVSARWSQVWCGRENSSAVHGGNRCESTDVCRRGFVSRILTHSHTRVWRKKNGRKKNLFVSLARHEARDWRARGTKIKKTHRGTRKKKRAL